MRGGILLGREYVHRKAASAGLPVSLTIETTSICNLKCTMCPYPIMTRRRQHMPFGLFEKIIAEAKHFVEFAILHLFGEPLLNPDIFRMVDLAEENGIRTLFSTNATKLDAAVARALLGSQLSFLQVCLDGASAETYERIRVGGDFSQVVANIRRFGDLLRNNPSRRLKVALQMIEMSPLREEQQAFLKQWNGAGFDALFIKPFHVWANQDRNLIQLAPAVQEPSLSGVACFLPWSELTILSDGRVVPCCNDYDGRNVLGDVTTESIAEIWNGSAMRKIRRMFADTHSDRIGTICASCPVPRVRTDVAERGMGPFHPKSRWSEELGFEESTSPESGYDASRLTSV